MRVELDRRSLRNPKRAVREIFDIKGFTKRLDKGNETFMRAVWRDSRRKAPKDTGNLRDSIKLKPTKLKGKKKQWKVTVDAIYGAYQEFGFTPHYVYLHPTNKIKKAGFYYVKKHTPFIVPSLEKNMSKLMQGIDLAIRRGLRK